jgi:hypothetical protein
LKWLRIGKISQIHIFSSQVLILLSQVVWEIASRLLMQVSQPKILPALETVETERVGQLQPGLSLHLLNFCVYILQRLIVVAQSWLLTAPKSYMLPRLNLFRIYNNYKISKLMAILVSSNLLG